MSKLTVIGILGKFKRYTNAYLKISLHVLIHIKILPLKFCNLNPKLCTHKVCEMFVYKHTETTEYVEK